ncbi:nucleotidyltransferase-like protein [Nocardia tenerifensis]|uniref:Nucleotidyltransferase-like protein n=1 Tax=Nocardia tenerifensis TaxID=228006 RepID=A0A318KA52_9NOCA|nr:nucleotidyltransferase domain-containing protein [Nocardia tenerifensis]PXX70757.1 nucleotidyltransferase-like protein [Nocardia tenerifensis]
MSLSPEAVLEEFAARVRPVAEVVALLVGGSLATGDFQPGVSDFDLVALIERPLTKERRRQVERLHREFIARRSEAAKLHCVYVPVDDLDDVTVPHVTWAARMLFERPLTGIARAELQRFGFSVFGQSPQEALPPVTAAELREAVRDDLRRYWVPALRRPMIWFQDLYVDLSLFTLARAEVTLTNDELITKREALSRLERFHVPADLIDEIRQRREGQTVPVSPLSRVRRAWTVHRLVSRGLRVLLRP